MFDVILRPGQDTRGVLKVTVTDAGGVRASLTSRRCCFGTGVPDIEDLAASKATVHSKNIPQDLQSLFWPSGHADRRRVETSGPLPRTMTRQRRVDQRLHEVSVNVQMPFTAVRYGSSEAVRSSDF